MRAVDTNVLVRLLVKDDKGQALAAEEFARQGAWISTVVLVETVWVLTSIYGRNAGQLSRMIEMLLNHQYLMVQDPELTMDALDLFRSRPSLGFSDCLILQLARKAGHLPLATFDRALARLDGVERL